MTDSVLERNSFYQYLQKNADSLLAKWKGPFWKVCVPHESTLDHIIFTPEFAECHALWRGIPSQQYTSSLFEEHLFYDIVGTEERSIIWNCEKECGVIVSEARIMSEYLITVKEHVVHVLLIDRPLPSMIDDDQAYLSQPVLTISSNQEADDFLKSFLVHQPLLNKIAKEIKLKKHSIISDVDVANVQSNLHGLILSSWESLIRRHTVKLQTDPQFQDLLIRALDFFVVGMCHEELWAEISDRCSSVDQMVASRMAHLRSINMYQLPLGLPEGFYTPLSAAIVELAMLNAHESAIHRLNCIRDTIELIQAHAKETWATLQQFQDSDADRHDLLIPDDQLVALMVIVLVQSRTNCIVSNIYYMTHYVFSISEERYPLWQSLHLLRRCLQLAMTVDLGRLTPEKSSMRKELSLQDLMEVTSEVEARFESAYVDSRSIPDMTALDLHMQDLTRKLHASTQASFSAGCLEQLPSPSTKRMRIMDFLSSIPSTIRASFRRKQTEQKVILENAVSK